MLTQFKKHINAHLPFIKGKKILIAISGGIDSVALTHLLYQLKFDIKLAHCNFGLRSKDADIDEAFVKNLAQQLNVTLYVKSFQTQKYANENKLSIQMAARKLRYEWFDTTLNENSLDYIMTAHHLDDNLETFLINFTRGTGLNGLTGIPEISKKIIRPLLTFSRAQIETYATNNNITWREDKSNTETKYVRNKIRHKVIPSLKEINPSLITSFKETTENLQGSQQIIDDIIKNLKKEVVISVSKEIKKIDIAKIQKLSNSKVYLYELLKEYGFTEWNDVNNLLNAQSGKQVFSKTYRLLKNRNHFILEPLTTQIKKENFIINEEDTFLTTEDFSIYLTDVKNEKIIPITIRSENIILVDKDKLIFPLQLRKWQKGDYFYPLSMTGKKKLSKFFKDEKLSLIDKENAWLLCSNNEIVWVVNKRLDDRYKLTNNTKNIVQIEFNKSKDL